MPKKAEKCQMKWKSGKVEEVIFVYLDTGVCLRKSSSMLLILCEVKVDFKIKRS